MPPLLDVAIRHRLGSFTLDVELTAPDGPLVIIGPSGAGKTLLVRSLAGIVTPDEGRIEVNGRTLYDSASGMTLAPQSRRVGYVPQEYGLFPHLTVRANIAYGLRGTGSDTARRRIDELLELTGLSHQEALRPRQLSGGQRQRVSLARALAVQPDVLLLDEPFASLDVPTRQALIDDLQQLLSTTGTAAIVVTHDRNEALRLGNYIAVLMNGSIRQAGSPSEIFSSPQSEEVAAFVGVETILHGCVRATEDGLPVVEVAGHRIEGGSGVGTGDAVLVCLRPEDVTISRESQPSSARNHLAAVVTRLVPAGPYVRVEMDAGPTLVAMVTRHAVEELTLAPGVQVIASFKASAVHLIRK